MKRCSTCNRTFTDPNLRFCTEDGTPLTDVAPEEDDATVVTPRNDREENWNEVAYQPPRPYVPPGGTTKRRRRAWPWVVGILGAFILGILAIGIAAAMLAPRVARRIQQGESNTSRPAENSNTAPAGNSNTNSAEHVEVPAPSDHDQVITQLKDIENEWTVANLNADKKKLDQILADDFVVKSDDGELISKSDYLRVIQRDTSVEKWEFSDLALTLTGDRAVLSGTITYTSGDKDVADQFTDKFVWRDGRWQATGSEVKRGKQDQDVNNH